MVCEAKICNTFDVQNVTQFNVSCDSYYGYIPHFRHENEQSNCTGIYDSMTMTIINDYRSINNNEMNMSVMYSRSNFVIRLSIKKYQQSTIAMSARSTRTFGDEALQKAKIMY